MSKLFVRFPSANMRGKQVGVCPLYAVAVDPTAGGVSIRLARGGVADQVNVAGVSETEVMDKLEELAGQLETSFLASFLRPDMQKLQDAVMGAVTSQMQTQLGGAIETIKGSVRGLVRDELQTLAVADKLPEDEVKAEKPAKKK